MKPKIKYSVLPNLPRQVEALRRLAYNVCFSWKEEIRDCRRLEDLPAEARAYVDEIGRRVGADVGIISVGPGREQTIFVTDGA